VDLAILLHGQDISVNVLRREGDVEIVVVDRAVRRVGTREPSARVPPLPPGTVACARSFPAAAIAASEKSDLRVRCMPL